MSEQNRIYKKAYVTLTVSPEAQGMVPTGHSFRSYDINTARYHVLLRKDGQPLPLTTAVQVTVYIQTRGGSVHLSPEILDRANGLIGFVIPQEFLTQDTVATCEVHVSYPSTNQSMDCGRFRFQILRSLIDADVSKMAQFYVESFEQLRAALDEFLGSDGGLEVHKADENNPHSVTKAQVGLGNADNTADSSKNVLSATKLTTARSIGLSGVTATSQSFNGTGNVTIPITAVPAGLMTGTLTAARLPSASTTAAGIVQLNNTLTSTSTDQALTATQGKALQDAVNQKASASHSHSAADITTGTLASARLPSASTTSAGIVQLNNTLTSTSTAQALTAAQGKALQDAVNQKAPASHSHSAADLTSGTVADARLPSASTTSAGIVQLNNTLTGTSTTQALTAAQGKALQDAVSAKAPISHDHSSITGNADSATKLQTARTINGVSFDGTADIVVVAGQGEFAPISHSHSGGDITTGTVTAARLPSASTTAAGIVQLNNTLTSTSTAQALTAAQGKVLQDAVSAKAPASHSHSAADLTSGTVAGARLPSASTTSAGIVQLNNTLTGTSTTQALTAAQGKALQDGKAAASHDHTSITGNAASASKLQTARTINGVAFDGTANITVPTQIKLLWEGSWKSGSISITELSAYTLFLLRAEGRGTMVLGIRSGEFLRGIGGYLSTTPTYTTYHFSATISNNTVTWVAEGQADHRSAANYHSLSTNTAPIVEIYGIR